MKLAKMILSSLLVLVLISVIAVLLFLSGIKRGAIPEYKGERVLSGLTGDITVYRDERGMSHIYAKDEHDLYYAVGYIMAEERLWQMDLIRRATTGKLSEIFGKDYVQTDLFLRSLEMTTKSKAVIRDEDHEILSCMQFFTDGVNKYIKDAGRKLPPEFRILSYKPDPWSLTDLANIIGYMGWDLAASNLTSDIFTYRLIQKLGADKASQFTPDWESVKSVVFPDFRLDDKLLSESEKFITSADKLAALGIASFSGSNNWAVSGKRTESGKPLLSNDMHLSFGSPGIWMQMHLVIPGKLNVTGVLVPGQPFIIAGHNEKIAWGMTNLMVDDIDLFAEKINPADSNQYFFNGEWKNMRISEEVIKIKGGTEQRLKLRFTHRGPVISGFQNVNDAMLSMRWSGYDSSDEIRSVFKLNRASNWEEFRSAISSFRSISQNFVYADVDGNIGLNTGGGIAIRKGSGTIIRNGETDEFDWKGYVPFEQLPFSYNPGGGTVSSANNKTADEDYPWYISEYFAMPYRINRIREMLDSKEVMGMEDFKRMINDQHSDYAKLITPFILRIGNKVSEFSPEEKFAFKSLEGWDYDMNKDLTAPTVLEFFRSSFRSALLKDELGPLYGQAGGAIRDYCIYRILKGGPDNLVDDITTPGKETLDQIILLSFKDCVEEMFLRIGQDTTRWKWGDVHKIKLMHPVGSVKLMDRLFHLNSREYRVGGSDHTVSPYSYKAGFVVNHGASERHIFNTANWDESLTIIPTGNSGIPASEFYMSQTENYINGSFYKDAFSEAAVKASAKYKLVLKPGNQNSIK